MCRSSYQDGEVLSVSGPLTIHKWATYERKWAIYDAKVGHLLVLNSVVRIAYRNHEYIKNAPQILGNALYKGQKLRSIFYFTSLSLLQNTPNPLFFVVSEILRT